MRFLFIAPRLHSNQHDIIEGLLNQGNDVEYLVINKLGNFSYKNTQFIKRSILMWIIEEVLLFKKSKKYRDHYRQIFYIPSIIQIVDMLLRKKYDIIIFRNRNMVSLFYNIFALIFSKSIRILYNQTPITENYSKKHLKIFFTLFPKVRFSPVIKSDYFSSNSKINKNSYFLPFIAVNKLPKNSFYINGAVNILSVGKFRPYKNHEILIESIKEIRNIEKIHVTIVGQVFDEEDEKYYINIKEKIIQYNLEDIIDLKKNVSFNQMNEIYCQNDIFVLTSHKEIASISLIEAMSFGLLPISTNLNGTATYIPDNLGYIFETDNSESLRKCLSKAISIKKDDLRIKSMLIQQHINENYNFSRYYETLLEIINSIKN